jgi:ribosomal protein L30E
MNFKPTLGALLLLAAFGTSAQAQLTRQQVKADLAEAIRTGEMPAGGESNLKLNQMYPARYPAPAIVIGKTREQVKAELGEAIRTGEMLAGGESGLKLNELEPGRYASRPVYVGKTRAQVKSELAEAIRTGDMPAGGESGLMLYEVAAARYAQAREAPRYAGMPTRTSAAPASASAAAFKR